MLSYPQLMTGAMVQFPWSRRTFRRTVVNRAVDGSEVRYPDLGAGRIEWELRYTGLTDAERAGLEAFFDACEGRLQKFRFLDPGGNLLRWSENLSHAVWERDGMLRLEGSVLTNLAQVPQGIRQMVDAPGGYAYAFAVRARAPKLTAFELLLGGRAHRASASTDWAIAHCSGRTLGEGVAVEVRLEPGASVEVSELQLDAQPSASAYRKTGARAAVYPLTRFKDDRIEFVTEGPDDHATTVRLVSFVRAGE